MDISNSLPAHSIPATGLAAVVFSRLTSLVTFTSFWTLPLAIVIALSIVIGLVMVVLFGYTSDQKAIGVAKDRLKAHLLAVRLYRDQIPVVMGSYGKILRGTGVYLKLAFKPLLYVIIPITLLMVQIDRYLGSSPIATNAPFLFTVHFAPPAGQTNAESELSNATIELPQEITMTAPPVHALAHNDVVWRLVGSKDGQYEAKVNSGGVSVDKQIRIGGGLPRISTMRLRGHFLDRFFSSAESPLPESTPIESISINYPNRDIEMFGYGMNWIWLFFILSMVAGFIFKELLGIQI